MALRVDDVDLERDRDLVRRYQNGDPRAFDDLYRRYFERLRSYCRRHVSDDHAAEELAQEAFVRAYRSMATFGGEQRFYPWMTVIAKRLCIDHHRRHGRVEPTDELDPGVVENDLAHLEAEVDRRHLVTALGRLGPRHREVLELREGQALSYQEIAETLAVPLTTVEALLHRARKALRREFATVTGDQRGVWGLPIVAWVVRRTASLRARGTERAGEMISLAAPAAAGLATAAIVLLPGGDVAPDDGDHGVSSAVESSASTVPEPLDAPVVVGEPHLAPNEPPVVPPNDDPATEAPAVAPPTAEVGGVDVFVGEEGTDEARERAQDLPTNGEAGPATAGVDLANVIDDVMSAVYNPATENEPDQAAEPSGEPLP